VVRLSEEKSMASIEPLWSDFAVFEQQWADLKPFLGQYLPNDKRLAEADHIFAKAKRCLDKAGSADKKRHILFALWWYHWALILIREHNRLADELSERGLEAQKETKRRHKAQAQD